MLHGLAVVTPLPTEAGAHQLIEHGDLGLIAWLFLAMLLALISVLGIIAYQWRSQNKTLRDASEANRAEREEQAARYERLVDQTLQAVQAHIKALGRLCSRLEERPCLTGAHLMNGDEGPALAATRPSHPGGE